MKDITYDHYFYKALGERMRIERKVSRRTPNEAAEIANVALTTLFQYESGARKMPLNILNKLCLFYNTDIVKILNDAQHKTIVSIQKDKRWQISSNRKNISLRNTDMTSGCSE